MGAAWDCAVELGGPVRPGGHSAAEEGSVSESSVQDSGTCFDPGRGDHRLLCRPRAYGPDRSGEEVGQQHRRQHSPATGRPPGPRM